MLSLHIHHNLTRVSILVRVWEERRESYREGMWEREWVCVTNRERKGEFTYMSVCVQSIAHIEKMLISPPNDKIWGCKKSPIFTSFFFFSFFCYTFTVPSLNLISDGIFFPFVLTATYEITHNSIFPLPQKQSFKLFFHM